MTSNTVPIYRNGRKFYVSSEEYERIRAEERLQRRSASQKSQYVRLSKSPQPFTRIPSTPSYTPIQRTQSNPYDYKYGILRTPYLPPNSLINTLYRREPNRLSRSILRTASNYDDLLSLTSAISKKQTPTMTNRSHSSEKLIDNQKTLLSSNNENETKRSSSADTNQLLSSSQQQKSKQSIQSSLRRPESSTISNYGISPLTTFSMTPKEQSHTQRHPSKLTNYLVRMKPSSLNSSSKTSPSAQSTTGSLFESAIQGSDNIYTVLGTSNQSNNNDSKMEDPPNGPLVDENSSSLLSLLLRRNTDINRSRRSEYLNETDDDQSNPQRDLWTRSTIRSQSSDGLTEKKRVRFADTEGLTLETISDKTKLKTSINNRLLLRRQHVNVTNEFRPQPFYNALYQATTKTGQSKLATDV